MREMAVKKFDVISFHGKYCDETFQIDRDLSPNGEERKGIINDAFCEWDYWETMTRKKVEEVKE